MALRRSIRATDQDPFTDLLFNALLAFTFLFIVAVLFLNPPARSGIIDPKAEFIITTTWPDGSSDDIDTWVEDPDGNLLWFNNASSGLMHLDRDDRGMVDDTILVDGLEVENPLNQEVVTIRGFVPGEYVVNLHYYESHAPESVPVRVRVAKVNPALEIAYYGERTLQNKGEEVTAVRFSVTKDGRVTDVNTIPKRLVTLESQ